MMCGMPSKKLSAQEKVTQEWDAMAGEWDDLAAGYAKGFSQLLPPLDENMVIVDFGCGTGLLTGLLRSRAERIIAMDASSKMIEVLDDKIRASEWSNVEAMAVVLSQMNEEQSQRVGTLDGSIDLIVASSVMSFVPEEDLEATMQQIGKMLKPGGRFIHSDWPKSEAKHPDAMSTDKAEKMYLMAGLQLERTEITRLPGNEEMEVFFGIARKD